MDERYQKLKKIITDEVFVTGNKERIDQSTGEDAQWLFDFRRVLLRGDTLDLVSGLFWEKCKDRAPFQVGGVEVAAIPLIAALVLKAKEKNIPINGFFIRKSRKKQGLMRMIEGELTDERVILVDDLMNSGNSLMRQEEILKKLGKKVVLVLTILRFRNNEYYQYFHDNGIEIQSLFTLDDFADSLQIKNLVSKTKEPVPRPFKAEWRFESKNPNYFYVVPKSAPISDDKKVYFGADNGNFWAINQLDGSVAWKYKIGFHAKGKYIFSSPVISKDHVYFGAYDGNFYALDKTTGKLRWMFMEADWIGSSPCIAPRLNMIFVGLEFGLWRKQGGVVALDLENGHKKWEYIMPAQTPSSPGYSEKKGVVVCGCNNFSVYGFNARTGRLLWEFKTDGEVKESFAFDEKRGLVAFGSFDKHLYILKIKTGDLVYTIKTDEAIYSTPLIRENRLYVASLDKNLYCIDLSTGKIAWKFSTNGRIFASPEAIGDKIYIGSNDGRLYELDAHTGENTALFQATERITNKITYNRETGNIFLPTFANELYCLVNAPETPTLTA